MLFLAKYKKEDLKLLAAELGEVVGDYLSFIEIKNIIINSKNYDEDFAKEMLVRIKEDRIEQEEKTRRQEQEDNARKKEEESRQREEREHQYALEKLRIENMNRERDYVSSSWESRVSKRFNLQTLMNKFDPKENDISLYLVLFERQVTKAEIREIDWVSHLLALLPNDIIEIIARENDENADNYIYIKNLLLKRFKLSPEKFRQKFVSHNKSNEKTWQDLRFELKSYFDEWVKGLGINDFEGLRDLMIADQIKQRVPGEIQQHFIDQWSKIASSSKLADLLDEYDDIRAVMPKTNIFSNNTTTNNIQRNYSQRNSYFRQSNEDIYSQRTDHTELNARNNSERRKRPQCFECGSFEHLRPRCPRLLNNSQNFASINRISKTTDQDFLAPYTIKAFVNGISMPVLRDSGATIDLICKKHVTPAISTGENVWVQQPLGRFPKCLPIANIDLVGDFSQVMTKVAVVSDYLDQGRYLLGNRTASIIEKLKSTHQFVETETLSALQVRSQVMENNKSEKRFNSVKYSASEININNELKPAFKDVLECNESSLLCNLQKFQENMRKKDDKIATLIKTVESFKIELKKVKDYHSSLLEQVISTTYSLQTEFKNYQNKNESKSRLEDLQSKPKKKNTSTGVDFASKSFDTSKSKWNSPELINVRELNQEDRKLKDSQLASEAYKELQNTMLLSKLDNNMGKKDVHDLHLKGSNQNKYTRKKKKGKAK